MRKNALITSKYTLLIDRLTQITGAFSSDSLFKNSFYLVLSNVIMAGLGFVFWLLNTHFYKPAEIGIATTLISVMTLITGFSTLGLGNSIVKFLPASNRKADLINTSFTIVSISSVLISIFFVLFVKTLSPELVFLRTNLVMAFLFVLFVLVSCLNFICENIFIAHRATVFVLIKNVIFSVIKLLAPLFLLAFGAFGIFASWGIALTLALVICIAFLIHNFGHYLTPKLHKQVIKEMTRFSIGNYIAGFVGNIPTLVLPLLITNRIGPEYSAYFYMDITIVTLLYMIPAAVTQSMFSESSHDISSVHAHTIKSLKLIMLTIIPAIFITTVFGKYLLLIFGHQYSDAGVKLLQMFAISGIFVSINSIGEVLLKLRHHIRKLILVNSLSTVITLGFSYVFASYKLEGIGFAWFIGCAFLSIVYTVNEYLEGNLKIGFAFRHAKN